MFGKKYTSEVIKFNSLSWRLDTKYTRGVQILSTEFTYRWVSATALELRLSCANS